MSIIHQNLLHENNLAEKAFVHHLYFGSFRCFRILIVVSDRGVLWLGIIQICICLMRIIGFQDLITYRQLSEVLHKVGFCFQTASSPKRL